MFIASQTPHHGIARVLVCEAVLLFTLAAGRRLAELELVLLLVQVCVPMSIAVCTHVCNGVHCYRCVCLSVHGCVCTAVWCGVCFVCVYAYLFLYECVQVTHACHVSI